jgi:hypothetical protein
MVRIFPPATLSKTPHLHRRITADFNLDRQKLLIIGNRPLPESKGKKHFTIFACFTFDQILPAFGTDYEILPFH